MSKERFQMPDSELEERKVKFTAEIVCAIKRGFEQNQGVVQQLKEILGPIAVNMFIDILTNTEELSFIPSENMKTVYGQIAKRELERIEAEDEDDEDLTCGHTVEDHIQGLQKVVEKMSSTVN